MERRIEKGAHGPLLQLFANGGDEHSSPVRRAAMFKKEDALPRAQLHFALHNRHRLAGASQHHSDVRWHVIAAFRIVREIFGIFRYQALEEFLQIVSRSGISIFHDDDAAARMLNKNRADPVLDVQFVDLRLHFVSDLVKAFAVRAHFELVMVDVHSDHLGFLSCRPESGHLCSNGKRSAI